MRALVAIAFVLVLGASASASPPLARFDPVPPLAFEAVRLVPVSARVVASCRSIQARAGVPLLCPTLLPRATVGTPGLPPPALAMQPTGDFFRRPVAGVDISYGAPWEGQGWTMHRWRNRPCCFLHFDVFRRARVKKAIPKRAQRATLGGEHGLLVRAREDVYYGSELYWANHVRFLWRERGVNWVATLHTSGEIATERLLGRLIASLRPVDAIRAPEPLGVPVGRTPNSITGHGGSIWVASLGRLSGNGAGDAYGTVYRVDPSTATVTGRVNPAGGGGPRSLAVTRDAVWVATYNGVARVDPRSLKRVAFVNVGRFPRGLATAARRVWVANAYPFEKKGSLVSIDPVRNRRVGRRIPLGRAPRTVAAGAGALWVADELEGTLTRVDPARSRLVARIKVGNMPTAVVAGAGSLWVANTGDGTVSRIDPETDRVSATLRVGLAPRALAIGAGAVWVAATGDGSVRRIDPATARVKIVRRGLVDPLGLFVVHRTLWVTTNEGRLVRFRLGRPGG
jgi:YVTN family beta-propeller protein